MSADPQVRTYDPKLIVVIFGTHALSGFAEGTFLTVTRNGDIFEKSRGADGTVDRINKNARDFSVEAVLKRTSLSNDVLSAIFAADINANTGVLPLTIKDLNGTTLFFAQAAWIGKDPDDEEADTLPNRTWRMDTGIASKFTGGNLVVS